MFQGLLLLLKWNLGEFSLAISFSRFVKPSLWTCVENRDREDDINYPSAFSGHLCSFFISEFCTDHCMARQFCHSVQFLHIVFLPLHILPLHHQCEWTFSIAFFVMFTVLDTVVHGQIQGSFWVLFYQNAGLLLPNRHFRGSSEFKFTTQGKAWRKKKQWKGSDRGKSCPLCSKPGVP